MRNSSSMCMLHFGFHSNNTRYIFNKGINVSVESVIFLLHLRGNRGFVAV